MVTDSNRSDCPCGSGSPYARCCEPYIAGRRPAPTAEALMRSRYSAYARRQADYLVATTDPAHRKGMTADQLLAQITGTTWLGLTIEDTEAGGAGDDTGSVSFVAEFVEAGRVGALRERSRFRREDDRWYYQDGEVEVVASRLKLGRNDPCPCGSGNKFKRCCGAG